MNIVNIFIVPLLICCGFYEVKWNYDFQVHQYPDNYISDSVNILPVNYGHLVYFNTFINCSVSNRKQLPYTIERRNNFLTICLLLCGDIHPCPGPSADSSSSSSSTVSDYKVFSKRGLHFIHINARSLLPKLHEIDCIARRSRAACICVSETWLDYSVPDSEVNISNYCIQRRDRNRQGGGVCTYIRKDLSYNTRNELMKI